MEKGVITHVKLATHKGPYLALIMPKNGGKYIKFKF